MSPCTTSRRRTGRSRGRWCCTRTRSRRRRRIGRSRGRRDVGAVACRGRAVDEGVAVRQDVVLERDDGARVAGAVAEDARSASAAQPAGALASATVGDARALPYDDASADALVMLGQLYHLIEAGDLPAAGRRNHLAPPYRANPSSSGTVGGIIELYRYTVPCTAITVPCAHDGPTPGSPSSKAPRSLGPAPR